MEYIKPPLGLEPRFIWDSYRKNKIVSAMERYTLANKKIPDEWLKELIEINNREY